MQKIMTLLESKKIINHFFHLEKGNYKTIISKLNSTLKRDLTTSEHMYLGYLYGEYDSSIRFNKHLINITDIYNRLN